MKQLILILCSVTFAANAQDRAFELGINIGAYKGNKHTAIRYDGADVEYANYNLDVAYYHGLAPNNSFSVYERVKLSYGDLDWAPSADAYPGDMRYNFGLDLGIHLGYKTDESNSIFVDANFSILSLNDALIIEVDDPSTPSSEADLRVEALTGRERRLTVNPGLHFGMGDDPDATPYIQFGPNLTWVRVEKNSMVIQEKEYILTQFNRNQNSIHSVADYGGIGFGGFLGLGYRYRLSDQFVVDIGYTAIMAKLGLGPDFNRAFKLQNVVYLRVLLS